jgi:hypothetical protein
MKTTERHLIWGRFLWISLWVLILAGMVYDQIWNHFINPLGILMLSILIVGTIISRWRKQPVLSTEGWQTRTIFAGILLVLTAGYILVRIFVLK